MNEQQLSMHIGEVAERTELSHRTMRHWDEVGLVTPSGRTEGGFRLYTERDVQRLLLIRRMKPLGYTIDEMKELLVTVDALQADQDEEGARMVLVALLEDAVARRARLERQVRMADEFITILRGI